MAGSNNHKASLSAHLASMQSGDEHYFQSAAGEHHVRYYSEPAMGDNGMPARGYTVGHYSVTGPGEETSMSFQHSPHGPTLERAKPHAAEQAAKHIIDSAFKSKHAGLFNDRRGSK